MSTGSESSGPSHISSEPVAPADAPESAAAAVVARLSEEAPGHRVSVLLFDHAEERAVVLAANAPRSSAVRSGTTLPLRVLRIPAELATGRVHETRDLSKEPHGPLAETLAAEGIRSYASVPLIAEDTLVGSINIGSLQPEPIPADVLSTATFSAPLLAASVGKAAVAGMERRAEIRYRSFFEGTPIGLYRTDPTGVVQAANPAMASLLGYEDPQHLEGLALADFWLDEGDTRHNLEQLRRVGTVRGFEARMRRRDGSAIWVRNTARAMRDDRGELQHFEGSLEDVTERRRVEEELIHDALHDELTDLPNRALFRERLQHALDSSRRRPDYRFAILYLDFDRFKVINDSLGHSTGDQLLITAGRRLSTCIRQVDTLARLGGDEFAILLDGITDMTDATRIADRIHYALAAPMSLSGHEVMATASIGIAAGRSDYATPEDVLRDADIAMYQAKGQGPGNHVIFDAHMHEEAVAQMRIESDLRRAVERNEFVIQYQPIISLSAGELIGFEALVRWRHPERGLLPPSTFFKTAEETGLIVVIGRMVLEEATRQIRAWQKDYPDHGNISVSVNLSGKQFHHPDILDDIRSVLQRSGLRPESLHLEITEDVIIENPAQATDRFLRLRDLGVHLDIDNFGTGYSSLSVLSHFPVDILKTDRSFVSRMDIDESDREIVRAVFGLARTLGLRVVAEGVETPDQLAGLRAMGCQFAQGFFFGRPVDADDAQQLLQRDLSLREP